MADLAPGVVTLFGGSGFIGSQAVRALAGMGVKTGRILHPSPASPAANRGWAPQALAELVRQNIWPA